MRCTVRLVVDDQAFTEGYLASWLVAPGDRVSEGDPLLMLEMDKAQVEYPSPISGVLVETLVAADSPVNPGDQIAVIETQ